MKKSELIKIIKEEIESVLAEQTTAQMQNQFTDRLCKDPKLRAQLQRDQAKETNEVRKQTRAMLIMQSKMQCPDAWN